MVSRASATERRQELGRHMTRIPAQAQGDLVKRARHEANWSIRPPEHRKIITDLADRIEALEAAAALVSEREAALVRALEKIAGGHFQGASDMVQSGDWRNAFEAVQEIAHIALRSYDTPAVTSEPGAPFDGRQQPHGADLQAAEDRSIGLTASAIGETS